MKYQEKVKKVGEFYDQFHIISTKYFHLWKEETLFHWDWWVSLGLTVIPWIIWFFLRKKDSTCRLMFVSLFLIFLSSWFDHMGVVLGLWYYTGKLIPTIPSYMPWDFSLIPVSVTLLIQYKPNFSPIYKALLFALLTAFIGEPFFVKIGFYTMVQWKYFYSFPIYFLIYLAADWISKRRNFEPLS